jgi:hypothetical protein
MVAGGMGKPTARALVLWLLTVSAAVLVVGRSPVKAPAAVQYEVPMPFATSDPNGTVPTVNVLDGRRTATVVTDEWSGPLSKPVRDKSELTPNKFSLRTAIDLENIVLYVGSPFLCCTPACSLPSPSFL